MKHPFHNLSTSDRNAYNRAYSKLSLQNKISHFQSLLSSLPSDSFLSQKCKISSKGFTLSNLSKSEFLLLSSLLLPQSSQINLQSPSSPQ